MTRTESWELSVNVDNARRKLTWNDISCIHSIIILNETEAIHELDLNNLSGAMSSEVSFNVGLGCYVKSET